MTPPATTPSSPPRPFVAAAPLDDVLLAADALPAPEAAKVVAPKKLPVAALPPVVVLAAALDGIIVASVALPVIAPSPCGPNAV